MGGRFAHREGRLMQIEFALEHKRQNIGGRLRHDASLIDLSQAVGVMRQLLPNPNVQTRKGATV
jgi:hypothetical protein